MLPDLDILTSGIIPIFNAFPDLFLVLENVKLRKLVSDLKKENAEKNKKIEELKEVIVNDKEEIAFLANINEQFHNENQKLIKQLDRFSKYRVPLASQSTIGTITRKSSPGDSDTDMEPRSSFK